MLLVMPMAIRDLLRGALLVVATSGALRAQLPAAPASSPARIKIGGYAGITLMRTIDSGSVQVAEANAALILSGSLTPRISYLAELDGVRSSRENYAGRQDDSQLEFARLYFELTQGDLLRLRVGRFLTPVGQWNEIHAEPLTWTAVRPLASYRSFAKYSTGALIAGQGAILGRDAGYALWAAPSLRGVEIEEDELEFRGAFGGRVAYEAIRGVWLGASGGFVRERRPDSELDEPDEVDEDEDLPGDAPDSPDEPEHEDLDEHHGRVLVGMDLTARRAGFELRAEATWLQRGLERAEERTAFVQLAAPLGHGLFAIGRGELATPVAGRTARVGLVGLHWRAPRKLVLKLERQDAGAASRAVANGWFLSVSALF